METMVDRYQTELMPVAAELTARLVSYSNMARNKLVDMVLIQCETYTRLARESIAADEDGGAVDMDRIMEGDDSDKVFAAMGVAKTITTVCMGTVWRYSDSHYCASSGGCLG